MSTVALPGVAGQPAPASAAMAETSIKLSMVLDPSIDTILVRLAPPVIRDLFTAYQVKRGAEPSEEVEPTTEQISALAQVIAADLVPYADFSVLGPHGRRLLRKLQYTV